MYRTRAGVGLWNRAPSASGALRQYFVTSAFPILAGNANSWRTISHLRDKEE